MMIWPGSAVADWIMMQGLKRPLSKRLTCMTTVWPGPRVPTEDGLTERLWVFMALDLTL